MKKLTDLQKYYFKALNPFSHPIFESTKKSSIAMLLNLGSKIISYSLLSLMFFEGVKHNGSYFVDSQDKILYKTADGVLRVNISKFNSVYVSGTLVDTNADGVADYIRYAIATPRGGGQEFCVVPNYLQSIYKKAYKNSIYSK